MMIVELRRLLETITGRGRRAGDPASLVQSLMGRPWLVPRRKVGSGEDGANSFASRVQRDIAQLCRKRSVGRCTSLELHRRERNRSRR